MLNQSDREKISFGKNAMIIVVIINNVSKDNIFIFDLRNIIPIINIVKDLKNEGAISIKIR